MAQAPFQLFDALDPATEAALRASIERFGVLVPIAVDQHGNVLDGHHRKRIAAELGVSWREDVHVVADEDEARSIAATLNTDRRQLDAEQRRKVVADLRQQGHSLRAIGNAVGVSQEQVRQDLATVKDLTVPDRIIGKDGKSRPAKRTVVPAKSPNESKRAQDALASLDLDEIPAKPLDTKRVERIAREAEAERRRAEPIEPTTTTGDVELRHGDFRRVLTAGMTRTWPWRHHVDNFLPVPSGSLYWHLEPMEQSDEDEWDRLGFSDLAGQVDAIITDPPYPGEYVDLFGHLGAVASVILKPGGVLVAMTGQSYLPDYLALLGQNLAYRWTGCYQITGQRNRNHGARVATGWKPLLIFQKKGGDAPEFILDDVFSSDANDKAHHHWGQSESGMAAIVERLTKPGQLVVDPFLGGGTTAVVCRDLGRRFVGCDVDAGAVRTARERMA